MNFIRKILIFIKRDLQIMLTYKIVMISNYTYMIMNFFFFIFFAKMFGTRFLDALKPYGGDFISYILIGSIGWGFLWSVMGSSSGSLRNEMMQGTFEPIFLTPTSPYIFILAYTIWGIFMGVISMLIFLTIGFLFFDVIIIGNYIIALLILSLSIIMMIGFGLAVAGLGIYVKRVGNLISIVQSISLFLCGVYFPIEVLPSWIQPISKFLPFYYSIIGLRIALSSNLNRESLLFTISILFFFCFSAIILGIYFLKKGINKARKEGTMAYY